MASNFSVKISELPQELQKAIPFSIKVAKDEYNINDLPLNIQYLVLRYYEQKPPEIEYDNLLDAKFEVSVYSDLGIYTSSKDLILDYFKRYLSIRLGTYPYDVTFGCALKDQVMTKDSSLRQTLIANEISLVSGVLGNDYELNVKVTNYEIIPLRSADQTTYLINLQVEVEGEVYDLEIS